MRAVENRSLERGREYVGEQIGGSLSRAGFPTYDPIMRAISSPYLVPFDGSFQIQNWPTCPPKQAPSKDHCKKELKDTVKQIAELQAVLYAHNQYAIQLVFQASDAAGKDSTIKAILSGVNPAGCQVFSFKQPSSVELDHDFLWRTSHCLPERGRIGVFNRSQYEEVLAVRVHPEYLAAQHLPDMASDPMLWRQRLESILNQERHLAFNGTVIVKFFLHVSGEEQARRFIRRIDDPSKNYKFNKADLTERKFRPQYLQAVQEALSFTSRPWAPWYSIPADSKAFMQLTVAQIVRDVLSGLDLHYPKIGKQQRVELKRIKKQLQKELV